MNDPDTVERAFKRYDAGAEIDSVEDPNTIYTIKSRLDQMQIYDQADLEAFKRIRAELIKQGNTDSSAHQKLYTVTQRPADVFNHKLISIRQALASWEQRLKKARATGDEMGAKQAEHERKHYTREQDALLIFKSDLAKLCRQYGYVAQLIEFGDPDLESFAGFAKLLAKRLDGVPGEDVDVSGLTLMGYAIEQLKYEPDDDEEEDLALKPTSGGVREPRDEYKVFLSEIIDMLNQTLGDIGSLQHKVDFVNAVTDQARLNEHVVAQVQNNSPQQAVQGDLPGEVQSAVVRVLSAQDERSQSFREMARLLLSKDKQSFDNFTNLIYQVMKEGQRLEL